VCVLRKLQFYVDENFYFLSSLCFLLLNFNFSSLFCVEIPQLILLTKVDTMVTVKEDLSKVFHSRSVLEMRDKVAMSFGLPSYTVLPMQNLANSRTVSTEIKMLTVYNLRQILRAADDYLENFEDEILADTYTRHQSQTH
jgi:hypothetical protein